MTTHSSDSDEKRATGFPEPPGRDPGDRSQDDEAHHSLNEPSTGQPDPDEDSKAEPPAQSPS
jgi:hypothetical protein